jgi:hypothetical protein
VALLVAGAAAIGGGIYLVHEDGRPADSTTTPMNPNPFARQLYDTKGWAIASFVSAGVLIGAAAAIFALGQADAPDPASASDVHTPGNLF